MSSELKMIALVADIDDFILGLDLMTQYKLILDFKN